VVYSLGPPELVLPLRRRLGDAKKSRSTTVVETASRRPAARRVENRRDEGKI
jgi:hypothetical protein